MAKLWTCAAVADRYGVQKMTVWNWIRARKLPAIRLGRDYRVRDEDLVRFEQARMTVPSDRTDRGEDSWIASRVNQLSTG